MRNLHCDKCGATLCEICGRDITENEAEDGYKRAKIGGGSRLVHKSCRKEAEKDKQRLSDSTRGENQ